jgi:hypothetical protein
MIEILSISGEPLWLVGIVAIVVTGFLIWGVICK